MRVSLSALVMILMVALSSAQFITFERFYGGVDYEVANTVMQTQDQGYLITGYTYSYGTSSDTSDIYMVKTDSLGDTLWTRLYGGIDFEEAYDAQPTSDNGFIIVGYTRSFSVTPCTSDVYLIKTDANGDSLWTQTYGSDHFDIGHAVYQTSDNGYILTGQTRSFVTGTWDIYLIRTDPLGDTLWTKTYGDDYDQSGRAVQQTSDGGFIITGYTGVTGAIWPDIFLMKTDSLGDSLWTRTYGSSLIDYGARVMQTSDQGYLIAGYINWDVAWESDIYLLKTDSLGDTLWSQVYTGYGQDMGFSLNQTADSGYILAGFTGQTGFDTRDIYVIKTNDQGDTLWTRTYGGGYRDQGYGAVQTTDGGYAIAGFSDLYGTDDWDFYLIKTDANGNVDIEENMQRRIVKKAFSVVVSPNPFSSGTKIRLNSKVEISDIEIAVYDITGRLVKDFIFSKPGGLQSIDFYWDGADNDGRKLTSGVYILQIKTADQYETKKLVLTR